MPSKEKSIKTALIAWNSGGNLTNNVGVTDYLRYGGISSSSAENSAKIIIPSNGILTNLIVQLISTNNTNPSPGEGRTRVFTIRKSGIDTELIVKISDNAINGDSDFKLSVNKFDLISLSHQVNSNISQSAIGIASIVLSDK